MSKKLFKKLVIYGGFVVISALLVGFASGMAVNLKAKRIEVMGGMEIAFEPKDATLFVNSELKSKKTPYSAVNIKPGTYKVKVSKDGYRSWEHRVLVTPGQVTQVKARLFRSEFLREDVSEANKAKAENVLNEASAADFGAISFLDYELFIDDDFVTRFSDKIKKAVWYSDDTVLVQAGREINYLKLKAVPASQSPSTKTGGSIDWQTTEEGILLLETLGSEDPAEFAADRSGAKLYIKTAGEFYSLLIR